LFAALSRIRRCKIRKALFDFFEMPFPFDEFYTLAVFSAASFIEFTSFGLICLRLPRRSQQPEPWPRNYHAPASISRTFDFADAEYRHFRAPCGLMSLSFH